MDKRDSKGWMIIAGMAILFLLWGLLVFITVGDKGPPPWDFGVVADVPGESPHSSVGPGAAQAPVPQHVNR
ncbi:MAG: hypothetical protein ACUVS3_00935 [Thermodesulfobacteriota bacterium]